MAHRSLPDGRLVGNGEVAAYGLAGGGQVFGYSLVTSYLMFSTSTCSTSTRARSG